MSKLATLLLLNGFAALCAGPAGCGRGRSQAAAAPDALAPTPALAPASATLIDIARAEDVRRPRDLPHDVQAEHDPRVRRAAARALARILDADDAPLLRALEDDDGVVVTWAAFGLGESCKGHEEAHVRALAARLASIDRGADVARAAPREPDLQPVPTLLRALGRCGGDLAEPTVRAWLRHDTDAAPAAYALADMASRGPLSRESLTALLDSVEGASSNDAALYAIGRAHLDDRKDLATRALSAARAALGRPAPERIFAVRALGEMREREALGELARVLGASTFTPAERAEAAHGLGRAGALGQALLADGVAAIAPDQADALAGDLSGVIVSALGAVSDEPSPKIESALWALARLERPKTMSPTIARRLSAVRCAAAGKLARGTWDADILRGCDVGDGQAGERATLASLDRGSLVHARRAAWLELTRSPHLRTREAALELVARHPELGPAALPVVAQGLSATDPGLVVVAATLVQTHPDRMFVLAEKERRAALDPAAPPPTSNPARELDPAVAAALRAALARTWSEDLVETRGALVDAGLAAGLDEGRAFAKAACDDANATVRARAARALAAAGEKGASCPGPGASKPAPEIGQTLARPLRVTFDTEAGSLAIRFDPALAPIAATRIVALVRSGFYTGMAVHRVVPGFVAQFGDRGGDGYGGAGRVLRCETSPVPFGPLDVGVALAGRDTGSSQIFVTLARTPRLDGEYAWIGRAQGDWDAVAEGDVIRGVAVDDSSE